MLPLRTTASRATLPHPSNTLLRLTSPIILTSRHASTTTPKPRVLEKPERFNPPSHGARLPRRQTPRAYPGAPLTHEQKTRRYPHMMPAEGTWMHSFLTNRMIHVVITMSVLISLVLLIQIRSFTTTTPYLDLLPPRSLLLTHPFAYFSRVAEVYNMHVAYTSQQVAEQRRQRVEDVRKRSEYRKAHGLDKDESVFGGWTARTDEEVMGPGMRESGEMGPRTAGQRTEAVGAGPGAEQAADARGTYVDFDGNRQPVRKKWFGIW